MEASVRTCGRINNGCCMSKTGIVGLLCADAAKARNNGCKTGARLILHFIGRVMGAAALECCGFCALLGGICQIGVRRQLGQVGV